MPHPLVLQLRFTRSEFRRALAGLSEEDAQKRIMPMNAISWNVGHLAWQEQRYWLYRLQNKPLLLPMLQEKFCSGCPALTPPLAEIWDAWNKVIAASDPFLDTLTTDDLKREREMDVDGTKLILTGGNLMQRVIYHYWYHTGESMAVRQMLGHKNLPDFVGNIDDEAPYQPH
jgi:uncharacterized damage-inducible protein DinB